MKQIHRIHLWLSLPFGIIITLICFTGAMLVFEPEITRMFHPEWFDSMGELIRQGGGHGHGRGPRMDFFMDMFRLHRWLLGSPKGVGKLIVGISTAAFVFVLISGFVLSIYKARKKGIGTLAVKFRAGIHRFLKSNHVAGGMYLGIFLLVMALTGLTWSFHWYRTAFYAIPGVSKPIVYAIHTGAWGGITTKVIWFVSALFGATLPLSGYYFYIRKRLKKKR